MSLTSFVMVVAIWIVHAGQRSAAVKYWCAGGLASALSSLLFAFQGRQPPLPVHFAVSLAFLLLILRIQSLRLELGEGAASYQPLLLLLAVNVPYEMLRHLAGNPMPAFGFAMVSLFLLSAGLAWMAWRLWRRESLRSALWIVISYAVMALMYVVRELNVVLGHFDAAILTNGWDALALGLLALFAGLAGNIGYLGIPLERSIGARVDAAAATARAEEALRLGKQLARLDRQRSLGAMAASFGHELNQPLTAILTNAQSAQRGAQRAELDCSQLEPTMERIIHNTHRACRIIERIRTFIGPSEVSPEPVSMSEIVTEVTQLLTMEAEANGVTISEKFDPSVPQVPGDGIQLSQVVVNVLRNAIEATATRERREIFINLTRRADRVLLRIQDTGPGFAPDVLAHVCEPFVTTKENGLGMGLSISRTIVEQHAGSLKVLAVPAGGALVEIDLPALASTGVIP